VSRSASLADCGSSTCPSAQCQELPLVRVFDVLSLQRLWSPRTLAVTAGVALVIVTFLLASRATSTEGAVASAVLVTFSPTILAISSALAADGVAVAFATATVWAAAGLKSGGTQRWRVLATGLLGGCAFAVKGPLIGPAVVAAMWLSARRRGWLLGLLVGIVASLVPIAASVPWGFGNVWSQFIALHLQAAAGYIDPIRNLKILSYHFIVHEAPLVLCFLLAVALFARGMRGASSRSDPRPKQETKTSARSDVVAGMVAWLVLQTVELFVYAPLFYQHYAYLVVPVAVLGGTGLSQLNHPWRWVMALVVLAGGLQLVRSDAFRSLNPSAGQVAAMHDLSAIRPNTGEVIADEPGLVWWAERDTLGPLVDTSNVRIAAGSLNLQDVVDGATQDDVCAVLVWSGRFDRLGHLARALPDYQRVRGYGGG
jgi:4-amino-4-deoxy-L-arabinose transferase-like glycosyltransferase